MKEFWEILEKVRPFKEQEQRRVPKGTELQHACDTSLQKGNYSQKPNSRMNVSVYFRLCVFTDTVTAVMPSLFWVPSAGHRGLRDCSCISWHIEFFSPGPTPPWKNVAFICWQITQGMVLCEGQLKGIKQYSKSFNWSLECVNTEPQALTEENLFCVLNSLNISGPVKPHVTSIICSVFTKVFNQILYTPGVVSSNYLRLLT